MTTRRFFSWALVCVGLAGMGPSAVRGQSAQPATVKAPTGLQGAWQQEGGQSAMLIAAATWVAIVGADALPPLATYTIDGDRLTLEPSPIGRSFNDQILEDDLGIKPAKANTKVILERFEIGPATMTFVVPNGPTLKWRRIE